MSVADIGICDVLGMIAATYPAAPNEAAEIVVRDMERCGFTNTPVGMAEYAGYVDLIGQIGDRAK